MLSSNGLSILWLCDDPARSPQTHRYYYGDDYLLKYSHGRDGGGCRKSEKGVVVDNVSISNGASGGLHAGLDAVDRATGTGLELLEEACTESGVEFGPRGRGAGGDGQGAPREAGEAGVVFEVGGDEGEPEVEDVFDLLRGLGDHFVEPGEQDVAEASGVACFFTAFVGEEGLEGENLEAIAFHFEVDDLGRGGGARSLGRPRRFFGGAMGRAGHEGLAGYQVRFTGMTT